MNRSEEVLRGAVEGACRGEKPAWDRFVASALPPIRSAVLGAFTRRGRGSDHEEVLDAIQEVFVRLIRDDHRLLREYDPERSTLSTYLAVVARSTAHNLLRRRVTRPGLTAEEADAAAPLAPPDPELPTLPLELLSTRQRLVLRLAFDGELEVPEIARVLGVTAQTVRSTRHKAILRLRRYFGGEEGAEKPPNDGDARSASRVHETEES